MKREKITLILCGGGVKGSFQAGFLTELLKDDKYEVNKIYASSIGSLLAPLVANKRIDLLEDINNLVNIFNNCFERWSWYYFPWLFKGIITIFFKLGIYKSHNILTTIWSKLSNEEKKNAKNICRISVWNIIKKQQDWFGGKTCSLDDFYAGITASLSLWLMVPPFKYKNNYYLDGGSCIFYPIEPILRKKINNKIIFLDTSTRVKRDVDKFPLNALELLYLLHDCTIDIVGNMQEQRLKEIYKKNVMIIRPDVDIFNSSLELNKEKLLYNFQLGREKYFNIIKKNI